MKHKKDKKTTPISRFIYWTPRIVSIIFILFLILFSLDVFGQGYGFWGTILAFLMHNILVFILTAILIISWKREIVGAVAFMLAGLLYILNMVINAFMNQSEWYMLSYSIIIAGPAFLIGILFWMNWRRRRTVKKK